MVSDFELGAGLAELVGAIADSVIGEQGAHLDAVAGIEIQGIVQKAEGGLGLLIGQQLGKGQAGVVVDGDVQGHGTGVLRQAAAAAVGAQRNLLITGKALDIEVQQIARMGVFVAHARAEPETGLASG